MRLDRGETASQPWPRIVRGVLFNDRLSRDGDSPASVAPCSLPSLLSRALLCLSLATYFSPGSPFALFTTLSDGVNCLVAVDIPFPLNLWVKGRAGGCPELSSRDALQPSYLIGKESGVHRDKSKS